MTKLLVTNREVGGQKTAEMGSIKENFKNLSSQHMQMPGNTRHTVS